MAANQPVSEATGPAIQVGSVAPRGGNAAIYVVLAVLVGLHLFAAAALSIMGLGLEDVSHLHAFLWLGTMMFQPGLVACWFALGTGRFFFRLAALLVLMGSFTVALLWGVSWNQGETFEARDLSFGLFFPGICLTHSILLYVLPRRYWRLTNSFIDDADNAATGSGPSRTAFSIRHLMVFLTAASLPLTLFGYLVRRVKLIDATGGLESLADGLLAAAVVALISTPLLVALLGTLLATTHRRRFVAALLAILVLLSVAALGIMIAMREEPSHAIQFYLIFAGYCGSASLSFWVLKCGGYRLTRNLPAAGENALHPNRGSLGFRSLLRPLFVLGVLFFIFLFPAGRLVEFRRRHDIEFAWRRRGVSVLVTEGQVTYARIRQGGGHDLAIANELLAELVNAPHVTSLDFTGSAITDAQLESLGNAPSLQILNLSQTSIGDAGIPHLVKLGQLKRLILRGSRVTAAGLQQIRAALPDCDVQPGGGRNRSGPAPRTSVTVPARTSGRVETSE